MASLLASTIDEEEGESYLSIVVDVVLLGCLFSIASSDLPQVEQVEHVDKVSGEKLEGGEEGEAFSELNTLRSKCFLLITNPIKSLSLELPSRLDNM